jgi:hypothetical protein
MILLSVKYIVGSESPSLFPPKEINNIRGFNKFSQLVYFSVTYYSNSCKPEVRLMKISAGNCETTHWKKFIR